MNLLTRPGDDGLSDFGTGAGNASHLEVGWSSPRAGFSRGPIRGLLVNDGWLDIVGVLILRVGVVDSETCPGRRRMGGGESTIEESLPDLTGGEIGRLVGVGTPVAGSARAVDGVTASGNRAATSSRPSACCSNAARIGWSMAICRGLPG